MAGIVAALEAHDDVGLLRQPVDDLALPFVAPLGADDDNIGHWRTNPSRNLRVTRARRLGQQVPSSGSCAQLKSRPWPLACEADNRIKEAGDLSKQEGPP